MSRYVRFAVFGMALTFALAACKDSMAEPEEALTLDEVTALFSGIRGLLTDTLVISENSNAAVLGCPIEGQVTVAIEVMHEEVADTVRLMSDITWTHDGCRFLGQGLEFTADGNPNVRDQLHLQFVGGFEGGTIEGTTTGTLDWALDDRSGTCVLDLVLMGPTPEVAGGFSGMMCGLEVSFDAEEFLVPS